MNRSIAFVAALFLCAGCAHTTAPKTETNQLASDILLGDSQHPVCARGEIAYCQATRASHFPSAKANTRCDCVASNLINSNARTRVTPPTPGTKVR